MLLIKRICLLVVLVLAVNITKALLPDDFEEHQFTGDNLQQECASRCPDLDFNQASDILFIYLFLNFCFL